MFIYDCPSHTSQTSQSDDLAAILALKLAATTTFTCASTSASIPNSTSSSGRTWTYVHSDETVWCGLSKISWEVDPSKAHQLRIAEVIVDFPVPQMLKELVQTVKVLRSGCRNESCSSVCASSAFKQLNN